MKYMFSILLSFFALSGCAEYKGEDGDDVLVQLKIDKQLQGSKEVDSYTNKISMKFNEALSLGLHKAYNFEISTSSENATDLKLVMTLKEMIDGKVINIGSKIVELSVGSSSSYKLINNEHTYHLTISTSHIE